jgi:hypothetical protein
MSLTRTAFTMMLGFSSALACTPPDLPGTGAQLSASNIRSLPMGATKAEVRAILGSPLAEHAEVPTSSLPAVSYFQYRRRGPWRLFADEGRLYVHFDSTGRVVQVYAKSGDDGVYGFGLPLHLTPWEHTTEFDQTFPGNI